MKTREKTTPEETVRYFVLWATQVEEFRRLCAREGVRCSKGARCDRTDGNLREVLLRGTEGAVRRVYSRIGRELPD